LAQAICAEAPAVAWVRSRESAGLWMPQPPRFDEAVDLSEAFVQDEEQEEEATTEEGLEPDCLEHEDLGGVALADALALADAVDRVERKVEALVALPEQVLGISTQLRDMQKGIQALGRKMTPNLAPPEAAEASHRGSRVSLSLTSEEGRQVSPEAAELSGHSMRRSWVLGDRFSDPADGEASTSVHLQTLRPRRAGSITPDLLEPDMIKSHSNWRMPRRTSNLKESFAKQHSTSRASHVSFSSAGVFSVNKGHFRKAISLWVGEPTKMEMRLSSAHRRGSVATCTDAGAAIRAAALIDEILGENANYPPPWWVMRPDSRIRLVWDYLLVFSIALSTVVVTFSLVYMRGSECLCNAPAGPLLHTADALWLASIAINFVTGFVQETGGQLVMKPRQIAVHYARGRLAFDVLLAWPALLLPPKSLEHWLYGLSRIGRLAGLPPLLLHYGRLDKMGASRAAKSLLAVALPAHLLACGWRLALHTDGLEVAAEVADAGLWNIYVKDLYWVLMTMTTVGYGDISPGGTASRLFSIFAMLVASVFFGTIVSLTSQAIGTIFDDPDERRVARAISFMRRRGVAPELRSRVEHSLRRRLLQSSQSLDSELFQMLTPTVQRELALSLLQEVVLQFPLFSGVNRSFVGELAQAQVWIQCVVGDVVAEEGQLTREVTFIVQGHLCAYFGKRSEGRHYDVHLEATGEPVAPPVVEEVYASETDSRLSRALTTSSSLGTGAWFGEACLFDEYRIRTATILARAESDLAILKREDFFLIIQRYPRLMERHNKLQTAIGQGKLSLEELAHPGR